MKHLAHIIRKILLIILITSPFQQPLNAQYLSNLSATSNDPVFTTYAAPTERSGYTIDQAYRLLWNKPQSNIEFTSKDGGSLGAGFFYNGKLRNKLEQYYSEPVITTSYSDLVGFYFYPYRNIRVEATFVVYSSSQSILKYKVINEGRHTAFVAILPYLSYHGNKKNLVFQDNAITFDFEKKKDDWMKNHNIPFEEYLQSVFLTYPEGRQFGSYRKFPVKSGIIDFKLNQYLADTSQYFTFLHLLQIQPDESQTITLIRRIAKDDIGTRNLVSKCRELENIDTNELILEDERTYGRIPQIRFKNPDHEAVYWNSFNLMRQCMMPAEGECSFNYYVFSREPKWGWGYGGQVFHESLVMLAYAYMDPESAMNSQRVYMERQWPSGYINYRTGPYLNEQIEHNGQYTSSAPWYNWQNLEIYQITGDKKFLKEAYESGKKFYNYYVSNRDPDDDGLCEWGAHAILECVRDARVAVWDKVGWPSNFEGPDVNAMLVKEAKALSEMAMELGRSKEAEGWLEDAHKRTGLINKHLWDDADGFYYNVNKVDESFTFETFDDLKIKEIIGFLPMWAGVADTLHAFMLMKSLKNPEEFWRKFGIPTLSAKDDYYNPIGYWNGPIWVQWQYLIFRGLLDYGYEKEAKELADKVLDNIAYHLEKDHVFWEFYSADDNQAGWNQTYIWTGIAARFLIDLDIYEKGGLHGW
nr:hypothetical protein [Bacteroidota bacterium]